MLVLSRNARLRPWCFLSFRKFSDTIAKKPLDDCADLQIPNDFNDKSARFGNILRWCGDNQSHHDGLQTHHLIVCSSLERDIFLQGLLVQMYGKCGAIIHAEKTFNSMYVKSAYAWNFIIRACAQQGQHPRAIHLFHEMLQQGSIPDKFTYVSAISSFDGKIGLSRGKQLHARIANTEIESDTAIATTLVSMYGSLRDSNDVMPIFDIVSDPDTVAWNALLGMYGQNGKLNQAFQIFCQMQQQGSLPTKVTFIGMLDACSSYADLKEGERIHVHGIICGPSSDLALENSLLNMYGRCSSLWHAYTTFQNMVSRNVITWTMMIALCVNHEQSVEAFRFFNRMCQESVLPEKVSYLSILSACNGIHLLSKGEQLHACLEMVTDRMLVSSLINMYGSCGNIRDAMKIFSGTSVCDAVTWNALISVYANNEQDEESLEIFKGMLLGGVTPTIITYISILSGCANINVGKELHSCIIENGFEDDLKIANALLSMYGKCGHTEDARNTFKNIRKKDIITWNAMIGIFVADDKISDALEHFEQMSCKGVKPDKVTYATVLAAYSKYPLPSTDNLLNGECAEKVTIEAGNSKLNKFQVLHSAQNLFDELYDKDVQAWNTMIGVYTQHGEDEEALLLFDRMCWEGILPNNDSIIALLSIRTNQKSINEGRRIHCCIVDSDHESNFAVGTALITMYGSCDMVVDAERTFDRFVNRNVVLWTSMINVYTQNGHSNKAVELFYQMQHGGIVPNNVTYISILDACSYQGAVDEGKRLHSCIITIGISFDVVLLTSLIDMYSKCGELAEAETLFSEAPLKDILLWNTMISLYSQHGVGTKALMFLKEMQTVLKPDKVTFISILTACSHCGLVDEAFYILGSMDQQYPVFPNRAHYICIIDLLGRAGQLEKAQLLIEQMPFLPVEVPYLALLRACQQQADSSHGEWAALHSFELDRGNTAPYVLLSNIHAVGFQQMIAGEIQMRVC